MMQRGRILVGVVLAASGPMAAAAGGQNSPVTLSSRTWAYRCRSVPLKNVPKTGGISLTTARRLTPSDWSAASSESS